MHKFEPCSYKLVLYSFTALPAKGWPVHLPACVGVITAGMHSDLASVVKPPRSDSNTAPTVCFLMISRCDDFRSLLHAGVKVLPIHRGS